MEYNEIVKEYNENCKKAMDKKETYKNADEILGEKLKKLCSENVENDENFNEFIKNLIKSAVAWRGGSADVKINKLIKKGFFRRLVDKRPLKDYYKTASLLVTATSKETSILFLEKSISTPSSSKDTWWSYVYQPLIEFIRKAKGENNKILIALRKVDKENLRELTTGIQAKAWIEGALDLDPSLNLLRISLGLNKVKDPQYKSNIIELRDKLGKLEEEENDYELKSEIQRVTAAINTFIKNGCISECEMENNDGGLLSNKKESWESDLDIDPDDIILECDKKD